MHTGMQIHRNSADENKITFSIISMIFGWVPAFLVAVFPFISQGRVPRNTPRIGCFPNRPWNPDKMFTMCTASTHYRCKTTVKWSVFIGCWEFAGTHHYSSLLSQVIIWTQYKPQYKPYYKPESGILFLVLYCFYDIMTENDEDVFINTETIQKPVLYASLGFS